MVAESALDRLACGLGGKTVFPQIMNLTPGMLQVTSVSPHALYPVYLVSDDALRVLFAPIILS